MDAVRSPLATFDSRGDVVACTRSFRAELDALTLSTIGEAVRALAASHTERQWVVARDKRVLIEVLIGPGHLYAARIYPRETLTPNLGDVLSPRQFEIAEYAAVGATAKEIAKLLGISAHTVRQHLKEVYRRLGVANRIELSRWFDPDRVGFRAVVAPPPANHI